MKYKTSYIYVRLSPQLKAQLKSEASLAGESIQTYVESIIRYRKRMKVNVETDEGYYRGYR
jgi:predicted HicB family RNase H-like nuclease